MFKKIFEPIKLRGTELKNRLIASPVTTNFASEKGDVTEKLLNYYKRRAEGGASLVIVEGSFVHPAGKAYVRQLGIYSDHIIPSLQKLVKIIHESGAKASIQIQHAGRRTNSRITGFTPKAPSAIACYSGGEVPEELTTDGIKKLVEAHVMSALRAKKAGFDSVDIHGAHGYLIPSFFSSLSNKRTDEYGGSLENRVRFATDIIKGIREVVGGDFPITIKISGDEYAKGGLSLEDMVQIAPLLEKAGVDAISVSAGTVTPEGDELDPDRPHRFVRTLPMGTKPGCFAYLASAIKASVNVPVMGVGRINTPSVAEEILQKGAADLICLGRGLLADPDFPKKAWEGRPEDIRACIACNQGCFDRLFLQKDVTCTINPSIGHEGEYVIQKVSRVRNVWVVGGGPAGMEAARIASLRGNRVTLFDDQAELGGQLRLASIPPDRREFDRIVEYQKERLKKANVLIKTNTHVDRGKILQEKPDTIIFATGSIPLKALIEGVSNKNVKDARDVLVNNDIEKKRVIVIGGGMVGCETAEFLVSKGNKVVLIEMLGEIAADAIGDNRKFLIGKLDRLNVAVMRNTTAKRITEEGVYCSTAEGEKFVFGQVIVLALGAKSNRIVQDILDIRDDYLKVGGKSIKVLQTGDCVEVRTALEAFYEGFRTGLEA